MQTFLPHPDPFVCAYILDNKRLGKQRVEGKQILDLLEGRADNKWRQHPAVRMWCRYEQALRHYINRIIHEWKIRGNKNNMEQYFVDHEYPTPPWLNDNRLFYSHRANLIRKFPEHYGPLWPEVDPNTPYWWPVELKTKKKQEVLNKFWGEHACVPSEINKIILVEDNSGRHNPSWYSTNN